MTTIGTSSLYSGTINGLSSLDLDTLNVTNLDANDINGDFFSINTIECNDLQVDNELDLTANGVIKIGKNTPSEITITDTQLGYLDGVSSNIQNQLQTLQTNTQHITSAVYDTYISDSTANLIDAPVDNSITNLLSPTLTHFDKSMVFLRNSGSYRNYFLGMTGDNTNFTNRFAIGCNGINADSPTILMEIDGTGEVSMRNGLKIFDLQGNNVGTINNFTDDPYNPTFSIIANSYDGNPRNLYLSSNNLIDVWCPAMILGRLNGSRLIMRTDTANAFKSRIEFNDLTLYGGLGNVANDASIVLNGETQNHAYTDADHTAVNNIANIESDVATNSANIATNTANIATNTTNIGTNTTDIATNTANITTLQNEMDAVEALAQLNFNAINDNFYRFNPVGTVLTFAGNVLPTGYLYCSGQSVSQTTYADLYAVIGTIYSKGRITSPPTGHFFLPDLRGLFICGASQPQTSSFGAFNTPSYNKTTGDFNQMSVQNHTHRVTTSSGTQSAQAGSGATSRNNATQTITTASGVYYGNAITPMIRDVTEPFNMCMNYIIKY